MRFFQKLLYIFFIILVLTGFVFFGGGRVLIRAGKRLEKWEFKMKERFGYFCQQGDKELRKRGSKVTRAWQKNENLGEK